MRLEMWVLHDVAYGHPLRMRMPWRTPTALNRGKWENRSEGQKVEVLVTHSGENLSVTNA